jgi:lysozyme
MDAAIALALPLARLFEGWRARPYLCPAGVPTQGYGATGKGVSMRNGPWSLEAGEARLAADMAVYARGVLALSPNLAKCQPEVLASLADFAFNLGVTRYKASTLRKRVADENWGAVAHELGKWVHGGGRRLPGLVKRRAAEARMILSAMPQGEARRPDPAMNDEAAFRGRVDEILKGGGDVRAELLKLLQG